MYLNVGLMIKVRHTFWSKKLLVTKNLNPTELYSVERSKTLKEN